jgi:hypothetical protein
MALLFLGEFGADDRGDVVAVSRWVKCEGDAVDVAGEREGRISSLERSWIT